jgi:hypothetical protein
MIALELRCLLDIKLSGKKLRHFLEDLHTELASININYPHFPGPYVLVESNILAYAFTC